MAFQSNKSYYSIGEVSRIIGVEPYVLRYWESEFSQIRPRRADTNQRTYQKKDLEIIMEVKRLLYEEKLTIEGAKKRLTSKKGKGVPLDRDFIESIKTELQDIHKILDKSLTKLVSIPYR